MGELKQFFLPDSERIGEPGGLVSLSEHDSHHLKNVLRLRPGAQVRLIDQASARSALATVHDTRNRQITCVVDSVIPLVAVLPPVATLLAALCKGKKNEFIIEKATELGVLNILLVHTENGEFKFHGDADEQRKISRWQSIAGAAARQSRRDTVPELTVYPDLKKALEALPETNTGPRIVLSLNENARPPLSFAPLELPAVLAVGPEGDFRDSEYALLAENRFEPLSLGSTILRSETAVVAGLAAVGAISSHEHTV